MNWVVSLVGRGGPAVSRCGHETRRHRVRGALFASVFASVLLAACGGGAGNDSVSTNYEPEPPKTGPLTATGSGDGQGSESENEQQQQKIIVNQEEEIVVNIQPEPEEEESEEEQEQQQQQLTIIEEEDIPYVEQEEEGPRYSAATQATNGLNIPDGLNIGERIPDKVRVTTSLGYTESLSFPAGITGGSGFPYGLEASERFSDNKIRFLTLSAFLNPKYRPGHYTPHKTDHNLKYEREDGFKGVYIYEGETGELTGDVDLSVVFYSDGVLVSGNISTDIEIEGKDLDGIGVYSSIDRTTGVGGSLEPNNILGTPRLRFGSYDSDGVFASTTMNNQGQAKLRMVLSPDGRHGRKSQGEVLQPQAYPSYIAGELQINGFKINSGDRDTNTLVGAFIGDNQEIPPRKIRKNIQGSIGMFSYGIWASESLNNRIEFLEQTTKFNPERTASDYTAHTYRELGSSVQLKYKREDGFKGVYIYEGETGELTGDVDLIVNFGLDSGIGAAGDILTDLEIGGYDLKGIAMGNGRISGIGTDNTHNTGVGGIDIDADGIDDNNTSSKLSFGDFLFDVSSIDRPTVSHHGLARKVKMVLSPDGIQAQGSTPETYPSQIAGEVEINGFKIDSDDGDNNTIVGVFVADKQE